MDQGFALSILLIAIVGGAAFAGRKSLSCRVTDLSQRIQRKEYELIDLNKTSSEALTKLRSELSDQKVETQRLRDFCKTTLESIRTESALLPSAIRWSIRLQEVLDQKIVEKLASPPRPAPVAAEQVREAKYNARCLQEQVDILRNRVDLYESQAPWLAEFADYTLEEILAGFKEESDFRNSYAAGDDPVRLFLSKEEWKKLPDSNRNQLKS